MGDKPAVYHERQKNQLCALHVLNNLLQEKGAFTKADLDSICTSLSPDSFVNPHKSMLGLGNYDVNVIMAAVQIKDLATVWFDKRKNVSCINLDNVKGLIVNVPSDFGIGFIKLPFNFKHWFTIRQVHGVYYNLDSKLSAPEVLGGSTDVMTYLADMMKLEKRELLLVVEPSVEQSGSWMRTCETGSHSSPDTPTHSSHSTPTHPACSRNSGHSPDNFKQGDPEQERFEKQGCCSRNSEYSNTSQQHSIKDNQS